jgi:hypothetical protein
MSDIYAYNPKVEWLKPVDYDNNIDHFFTQRKINEYEEYIDEKTLERKKKKKLVTYNFLALNLPNNQFTDINNLCIDIEIWGDEQYSYKGILYNKSGECPHLLLKLENDKQLFIKLIYKENDKILKTFISFIPIIKRYQILPE